MSNIDAPTAALIGASIAAVISLIGLLVNNFIQFSNNKANIHARRSEITLTKRLEAFADLASYLSEVREDAVGIRIAMSSEDNDHLVEQKISKLSKGMGKLAGAYGRNSIYFPNRINKKLTDEIELVLQYSQKDEITYEECRQLRNKCKDALNLLTEEIWLYLGEE